MSDHLRLRQSGSGLMLILICIAMLLAFSATLTAISVSGVRTVDSSEKWMRAFYLADSGAQDGIARVRASSGNLSPTSFVENLGGGQASVSIQKPGVDLYRILSTATYLNETRSVEIHVRFTGGLTLPGALSVNVSRGTEVKAGSLRVESQGSSVVSGKDHAADGSLELLQNGARYGLAMNPVPGKKNFSLELDGGGSSTVEGFPAPITNTAASQDSILKALRDAALSGAEVSFFGSKTLGDSATGSYGTAGAPRLVYARLGNNNSITMNESFSGYGTLVVEVDKAEADTVLKMSGSAVWHGLVLVYFRNEAEIEGKPLVDLSGDSRLVGGLALFFNSDRIEVSGKGTILKTTGSSSLLYSSLLVNSARGTEGLVAKSAVVTSYRLP
jgi:hypothetical protein